MPLSLPSVTHDPASGATIPSAWGDAVNAAIAYLGTNKPRCRVYNTANISIPTGGSVTPLTFNTERYDVAACHSTVSNTSRLTVPAGEGGVYSVGGTIAWANSTAGRRVLTLRINGTTTIAQIETNPAIAGEASAAIQADYALVAGDYVELCAFQTSGAALNVLALGNQSPEAWLRWVAT